MEDVGVGHDGGLFGDDAPEDGEGRAVGLVGGEAALREPALEGGE